MNATIETGQLLGVETVELSEAEVLADAMREVLDVWNESGLVCPSQALKHALTGMFELVDEQPNIFVDALANEVGANYRAITHALSLCRRAVDLLEVEAGKRLVKEAAWHRERLADIEAVRDGRSG
jgi:hypothetical protein